MSNAASFQDMAARLQREKLLFNNYNHVEEFRKVSPFDCHLNVNNLTEVEDREGEDEGVELSLGLSLHGRFGVDPIRSNKITKSASIANLMMIPSNDLNESLGVLPAVQGENLNLIRTCSLPVATEEEWKKRKDMQMLRRMEAKRKRSEKQQQRSLKNVKERIISSGEASSSIEDDSPASSGVWIKSFDGFSPPSLVCPTRQGSIGSQGSGSSGLSESESLHAQQEFDKKQAVHGHGIVRPDFGRCGEPMAAKNGARSMLVDMPHVSTRGLGPNSRKIEGFLYQYGKREEVRIVCVCHGNFYTPSEFVKHAGGGDVAHPLRHIVVDPSPLT